MSQPRFVTAAAILCGLALCGCAAGGGIPDDDDPGERPTDPIEIAAWAMQQTQTKLEAMNRKPHHGRMEFLDERIVSSGQQADRPASLRVLRYRLDNGLTVLLMEDHSTPVFAYHTWYSVGSRHERPGITGIAHLFEHLMFKETSNLAEGEFDKIMESHGAQTNASTWLDWTMYREELPSADLELAVRLEADRMEHMILGPKQLESERDVVENERRFRVDNDPEGTMFELLYALAYTTHPYQWPTIGWMKDIEAITLPQCLAFYKTYYAPNNATIVIAGDFRAEEALTLINAYYGHMPAQPITKPEIGAEPAQTSERRQLITLPISSPKVLYGYKIPALTDPTYPAVQVMHQIVLNGKSSRLFKRLVTESELASDVSGWPGEFADPGLYEILMTLKTKADPDLVEKMVDEELTRMAREPVTARELEKAKNALEIEFLRNMQSMGDRAYGLGHYAVTGGDYRLLFDATTKTNNVTAEDVMKVAKLHLQKHNRSVVVAMPRPRP
jgi:zinc protease